MRKRKYDCKNSKEALWRRVTKVKWRSNLQLHFIQFSDISIDVKNPTTNRKNEGRGPFSGHKKIS